MPAKLNDNFRYQTENLILRFYNDSDFLAWQKQFSVMKPKQNQWDWETETVKQLTQARFSNKLEKHRQERKEGKIYYFCVALKSELIGIALINNIDNDRKTAEIGFQLNNNYWQRGYGTELLAGVIDIAQNKLVINKIHALVNPKNQTSIKLLKNAGFIISEGNNGNQLRLVRG